MKRVSLIACTIASVVIVAAGDSLFMQRSRYRDGMAGGCANHRRRSLHAGYTLAQVR